jgi:hypothetical protein
VPLYVTLLLTVVAAGAGFLAHRPAPQTSLTAQQAPPVRRMGLAEEVPPPLDITRGGSLSLQLERELRSVPASDANRAARGPSDLTRINN